MTFALNATMKRYLSLCLGLVFVIIGTTKSLPSLEDRSIGTNSAGEMADSHISCYMRLVKIIAVMWNSQRGLAIGLITLWP